jgi:hypothetical protein
MNARDVADPQQRVQQGRALLTLMAEASAEDSIYGFELRNQVNRLKELEKENDRLRKAVSELTLEKLILKEAASGNF